VIHAGRVVEALVAAIADPAVRRLPAYGGMDRLSDNTDLLGRAEARCTLRAVYRAPAAGRRDRDTGVDRAAGG
jgi:hypothetical protein